MSVAQDEGTRSRWRTGLRSAACTYPTARLDDSCVGGAKLSTTGKRHVLRVGAVRERTERMGLPTDAGLLMIVAVVLLGEYKLAEERSQKGRSHG